MRTFKIFLRDRKNFRIRFSLSFAIWFIPGLWQPAIWHNREMQSFNVMFPGMGIAFDYRRLDINHAR